MQNMTLKEFYDYLVSKGIDPNTPIGWIDIGHPLKDGSLLNYDVNKDGLLTVYE